MSQPADYRRPPPRVSLLPTTPVAEISLEQWRGSPWPKEKRSTGKRGEREAEAMATAQPFPSSFLGESSAVKSKNILSLAGELKLAAQKTDRIKFYSRGSGWQTTRTPSPMSADFSQGLLRVLHVNSLLVGVIKQPSLAKYSLGGPLTVRFNYFRLLSVLSALREIAESRKKLCHAVIKEALILNF